MTRSGGYGCQRELASGTVTAPIGAVKYKFQGNRGLGDRGRELNGKLHEASLPAEWPTTRSESDSPLETVTRAP